MKKVLVLVLLLSAVLFSQVGSWQWQNSKPTGNDLRSVVFNPNGNWFIFGNAGTVLKSTDNGTNWALAVVDTGYRDIYEATFLSSNVGILCGYSGLIMKTTDAGKTWVEKQSGTTNNLWYVDFVTADTGYIVGIGGNVLKTTDAGETWSIKNIGSTAGISKVHFVNPSTGYIGTSNSTQGYLCKTTDYGNTWVKVAAYPGTGTVYGICFTDVNTGYVSDNTYSMYKTTDAGATWTLQGKFATGTLYEIRFSDANNGAVCGSRGEVWVTTNAGAVWTKTQNPFNTSLYALGLQSVTKRLITVGNGGVMSTSTDWGANWNMLSVSATVQLMKRIQFLNANTGYAVGGSAVASDSLGDIIKTTNGGAVWTKLAFNAKSRVNAEFWLNENVGWVGSTGTAGIFKSTDGGATFTAQTAPSATSSTTWYEIKFADVNNGYACGTSGIMVKTTDGGATWNAVVNQFGTSVIYSMHVFDVNTLIAVGVGGKAYKTTDGGLTWVNLNLGSNTLYSVSFVNSKVGLVSGSSGTLYKTTDGGNNWTLLNIGNTATIYAAKFQDENIGWCGGSSGTICYTTDGGNNWTKTKPVMSSTTIYDIFIKDGNIWMSNDAGAIIKNYSNPTVPVEMTSFSASVVSGNIVKLKWVTATETNNSGFAIERKESSASSWLTLGFVGGRGSSTVSNSYSYSDVLTSQGKYLYRLKQVDFDGTSVYSNTVEVNTSAPLSFELSQNYPNPFNPSTTIKFAVPVTSKVSLKIYDILGKEVAILLNEVKTAGNYAINFDGSNLSSGVYFYKLTAGIFSASKKFTLIK